MKHDDGFESLPRGVYLAPFTLNGDRYYYAIDELGEQLGFRTVAIGADPMVAIDELWDLLDRRVTLHDVSDRPASSFLRLVV